MNDIILKNQAKNQELTNTIDYNLVQFGYSLEEIHNLNKNKLLNNQIEVGIDELVEHMIRSDKYKNYPKSTIKYLIIEYKKSKKSILLKNDFLEYIDNNIEFIDQELWINNNSFLPYIDNTDIYKFSETEEHHISSFKHRNENFKQDYRNLISGICSSIISRTIVAPLDRLKMLYQVNYIGMKNPPSIIQGISEIYKKDGLKGYFKGNGINIIKSSPENGIKLYTFELTKWHLQNTYGENLSGFSLFFSGAISGVISTIIIFPLEVLKLRIATAPHNTYKGIYDAIIKIKSEPRGYYNFYSGIEANICAVIPNAGLNLSVYETLKILFSGKKSSDNAAYLSTPTLVFIGGSSAMISSTVLYPFQIIQARMIMYNLKKDYFFENKPIANTIFGRYKFFNIILRTYKLDGIRGFFKGYMPAITKIVIGNGIGFSIYENLRKVLGVYKK